MNRPTQKNIDLKNIDLSEDWTSHPAIEWLSQNKQWLIGLILGLIILLIAAVKLMSIRTVNAENDYLQTQKLFDQFQQSDLKTANANDLQQLEALMQKHPEIQPKYQGALAQTLLIDNQVPQAQVFANDIFKRTSNDDLKNYQDFTATSLLIGNRDYQAAIQQANQLKNTLEQRDQKSNTILYNFNLLRLALLYQQIDKPQEELKFWNLLQAQKEWQEVNHLFLVGHASLNQLIAERKKILEQPQ